MKPVRVDPARYSAPCSRRPLAPMSPSLRTASRIGVPTGVLISPLPLLGERGDQLPAEGRDVRDHAAPHRVKIGRGQPENLFERPPQVTSNGCRPLAGVLMGVSREARERRSPSGRGILTLGAPALSVL